MPQVSFDPLDMYKDEDGKLVSYLGVQMDVSAMAVDTADEQSEIARSQHQE